MSQGFEVSTEVGEHGILKSSIEAANDGRRGRGGIEQDFTDELDGVVLQHAKLGLALLDGKNGISGLGMHAPAPLRIDHPSILAAAGPFFYP